MYMIDCRLTYITYNNDFDFTEKNRCELIYEPLMPHIVNKPKTSKTKQENKKDLTKN